jgi:hypothetical protein
MVRHIARKHGGPRYPVNARSYAIKQPVSQVFLKITSFQLSTANSLQMIEN